MPEGKWPARLFGIPELLERLGSTWKTVSGGEYDWKSTSVKTKDLDREVFTNRELHADKNGFVAVPSSTKLCYTNNYHYTFELA